MISKTIGFRGTLFSDKPKWDMNGYELSITLQLQKVQYPAVPWGGKVLQSQVLSQIYHTPWWEILLYKIV